MMTGLSKQKYLHVAREHYEELINILQSDKNIAKALQPFYGKSITMIERNLSKLHFKNELNAIEFINAISQLLEKLENIPIEATVLFLAGEQTEFIEISQSVKKLFNRGLNVLAPQVIITHEHEQFWEYVKADTAFADFLVMYQIDLIDRALLEEYAKGKMLFDLQEMEAIINYAKYCTVKKKKFKF